MLFESDYRFCINNAIRTMKEQREKLYDDCINYNPDIYIGLHTFENTPLSRLYYEKYISSWINGHWEKVNNILENNKSYPISKKKEILLFFAEYFANLMNVDEYSCVLAKSSLPELLEQKRSQLNEMIRFNDNWENNNKTLLVQMKKSDEQYAKMIKEAEKLL